MARGFPGPPNTGAAPTPPALRGLGACGLLEAAVPSPDPAAPRFLSPTLQGCPRSSPARVLAQGRPQEARSGEEKRGGLEGGVEHNQMHCMHAPVPRPAAYVPHGTAWPLPRAGGGLPGAVWFGQEGEIKARILGSDERDVPRAGSRGAVEAPPPPARPGPRVLALSSCPVA